jgi:hypothetical protein
VYTSSVLRGTLRFQQNFITYQKSFSWGGGGRGFSRENGTREYFMKAVPVRAVPLL